MCHKELGWGESWHRVRSAAVSPVPAEPPSQCHRPPPPSRGCWGPDPCGAARQVGGGGGLSASPTPARLSPASPSAEIK